MKHCPYCAEEVQEQLSDARDRQFRLPSETEWEYACRAGTTSRYFFGDDPFGSEGLNSYAWQQFSGGRRTHPIGQKKPNPWGLYDIYGNLAEWCYNSYLANADGFSDKSFGRDPAGRAAAGYKAVRGGYHVCEPERLRSAYRGHAPGDQRDNGIGFRVVWDINYLGVFEDNPFNERPRQPRDTSIFPPEIDK